MATHMDLVGEFELARPRLLSLAHRMLGSVEDAEDVVQTAWLRTQDADRSRIDNAAGWFTTVTARLCVDVLRSRERRGQVPLLAEALPAEQLAADEEYLRREDVSRALLVLLDRLSPSQRVAYVLHDLFRLPFVEVAGVLDTTPAHAKKLASRARRRLEGADVPTAAASGVTAQDWRVVEAFLAAARGGHVDALVTLLAPDVVRTADPALLPEDADTDIVGSRAVADETRRFAARIEVSTPMLVDGRPSAVVAPGGHLLAVVAFAVADGVIARIEIGRLTSSDLVQPRPSGSTPGAPTYRGSRPE